MTNDPKLLSIIILVVNLLVIGPISWVIKDIKTSLRDLNQHTVTQFDYFENRLDSLSDTSHREYATADDLNRLLNRLIVMERRIYDLNASASSVHPPTQ